MLSTQRAQLLTIAKLLNTVLLLMVLGLLVTNIATAGALWWAIAHKSHTLLPPVTHQAFTVSDQSVDKAYLQQMAEYFIFLKLNVTPESVERNYGQLLTYVDPQHYSHIQSQLVNEAKAIKKQHISSSFAIQSVAVATERLQVRLTGELKKYVGNRALAPEMSDYVLSMGYPHGTLTLNSFSKANQS